MTILQTTQQYTTDISLSFDEQRGVYVGDMISQGGVHRVEGPDRASVMYELDAIVQEEYAQMVREASQGRGRSLGMGIGAASAAAGAMPVYTTQATRQKPKKPNNHILSWVGGIFSTIPLVIADWYDGVESLWDKAPAQKIFAASFGGILITATSRKMLRKKLIRQRNKRIQRVMMNVRMHDKERENASSTDNIYKAGARLRAKKKRAQALRPKYWERRISPQGQETGWQGRSLSLRDRIKDKKSRAKSLWAHKV